MPVIAIDAPHTLGGAALGAFTPGQGKRHVIASNADAKRIWEAGIEEWKILTSAALIGLSHEAVEMAAGYVRAIAPDGGLPGGRYSFPVVSVGATENALMAAVLCTGKSTLHNAAREPEIVDLCKLLVAMGAEIEGIGTSDITVHGVPRLHGATYQVMPDRIEAGSYACAAAITGGEVTLKGARIEEMDATVQALRDAGVVIAESPAAIGTTR
mgnify:CR=1 FL=1